MMGKLLAAAAILAVGTAPLADYRKIQNARMASVSPPSMQCCGKRCNTIAPLELGTAKTLCQGVSSCWGFSYDPDAKVGVFGSAVTATGVDSYVSPSGFSGTVDGFRSFHYTTKGAFFDIILTHTYQIPSSLCAAQCDDEANCNVFEMK